jgi:hypothetical protein
MIRETIFSKTWIPRFFIVLAGLVVSFLAGWLVVRGLFQWILFLTLLIPVALVVLFNPKVALVIIILSAFSLEYLAGQGFLPSIALWTIDGLVLLLFVQLLLARGHSTGWFLRSLEFKLLLVWAAMVLLSAVANASSPLQVILGMRAYIRFAFLYYCILEFEWEEKFLSVCLKLVTFLFVLQIPIALLQKRAGLDVDAISGTIAAGGSTGLLSVIVLGFIGGLTAYALFTQTTRSFWMGMALLVLPALASARIAVFLIPIVLIYILFRLHRYILRWQMILACLIVGLILVNFDRIQGSPIVQQYSAVDVLRNPRLLLDELMTPPVVSTGGASVGRFAGLSLTWSNINQSYKTLLLGYGPASAQGSRFVSLQSDLYIQLALMGGRASQLTRSLLEWGLLGTLTYVAVYMIILWKVEMFYRNIQDPLWKAAAFGFVIYGLAMVFLSAYTATWSGTVTAFLFWFVGAMLGKRALEGKDAQV